MSWFKSFAWIILFRLIRLRFPQVKPLATDELAAWLNQTGVTQLQQKPPPDPQFWGSQTSKSPRIGGFRGQVRKSCQKDNQKSDQNNAAKPLLLDARTPEEYQVSHLAGAQLMPADIPKLAALATPETPIVVYCSVGYRSAKLAQALQQAGYKQVFNLEGSLFRWMNDGRSVYRNNQIVQQVHPYNEFWGWFLDPIPTQK